MVQGWWRVVPVCLQSCSEVCKTWCIVREVFVCEEGPNPVWKLVLWPMCLACSVGVQTEQLLFGLSQAFELQWYDKGSSHSIYNVRTSGKKKEEKKVSCAKKNNAVRSQKVLDKKKNTHTTHTEMAHCTPHTKGSILNTLNDQIFPFQWWVMLHFVCRVEQARELCSFSGILIRHSLWFHWIFLHSCTSNLLFSRCAW